ncbi:MAG: hypothetical protein Q9227_007033 [Pyrenula ochraceoflavens]
MTGKYDEGNPVPEDNDAILFQNLNQTDIMEIQKALDAHPSKSTGPLTEIELNEEAHHPLEE